MYKPNCKYSERHLGGILCLSLTGWLFTIVFTYLGFLCMITGKTAFFCIDFTADCCTGWLFTIVLPICDARA